MRKKLALGLIVIILLVFLLSSFFIQKSSNFWSDAAKIFSLGSLINENISLRKENTDIKNQFLQNIQNTALPKDENYIYGKVFSSYPFNVKNRIYVNSGSKDGVLQGQAVTFSKTILVGIISLVNDRQSEAMTVFDPKFSLPVRIGKDEIDGLFQGGLTPKISLIDKTKKVSPEDNVISASREITYGLSLGKVKFVREDNSGAFFEAIVDLSYSLSDIRNIFIIKSN